MSESIFVLLSPERWQAALAAGHLRTPSLQAEGFIHAATRAQVPGVLERHFAGQWPLVAVEIDAAVLGELLRWEPGARSGELFPHVFAPVPLAAVRSVEPVVTGTCP